MAVLQTSLQNADNILLESAKIEYSTDNGSTFTDLGLADNVAITFNSTAREVQPGNGATPDIAKGSASQMATITAELWELSTQNYVDLTGGLFTRTTVAGTPLVGTTDVLAADSTEASQFYPFDTQQYDGSTPTSISIADDTPATYVLDTDYRILSVNGVWGYMFISGGDYDSTAVITVTYSVTPAVSETIKVGGSSSQVSVWIRITNLVVRTDVSYDITNVWNIYNAFVEGDIAITLKNKDETDAVARIPISLKGILDDSRTAGDQLYSFTRTKVAH